MANELHFVGMPSQTGLTVVARIYDSLGAQLGGDVSCPETSTNAIYVGDMPATGAGQYIVRFVDSSENFLASGSIDWDGTQEVLNSTILAASGGGGGDATAANQTSILNAISALNDTSAADVWAAATRTLTSQPDATLSAATLSAIATAVEQAILNEGDGEQVLNAIVGAIGNTNVDEVALVAAIRADLERAGGSLDNLPTLAEMEASPDLTSSGTMDANIVSVNNIPVVGTGAPGDEWGPV